MIKLTKLNKFYGGFHAIKNLSFEIEEGELIGFIGPNGAGKTTTFKCLTTLSKPSSGEITVNGIDVIENPIAVRGFTGYLPEETPLVEELTVKEYLSYRYALKNTFSSNTRSVYESIEICGLKEVKNKVISTLSKGFKQRTGIAESLLCSPKVLLLDEPGNGLDPEQIVNIRNLLVKLKKEHTIIVSSHILSELELICDRFLIICHGELKVIGSKQEILSMSKRPSTIEIELTVENNKLIEEFKKIHEIINIENNGNSRNFILTVKNKSEDIRPKIIDVVSSFSNSLLTLNWIKPNLESLYMELCSE